MTHTREVLRCSFGYSNFYCIFGSPRTRTTTYTFSQSNSYQNKADEDEIEESRFLYYLMLFFKSLVWGKDGKAAD